jgi:hypothetical protein
MRRYSVVNDSDVMLSAPSAGTGPEGTQLAYSETPTRDLEPLVLHASAMLAGTAEPAAGADDGQSLGLPLRTDDDTPQVVVNALVDVEHPTVTSNAASPPIGGTVPKLVTDAWGGNLNSDYEAIGKHRSQKPSRV